MIIKNASTRRIINPGFEQSLSGWISSGAIADSGHASPSRLIHGAGMHKTTQTLHGLANGWYSLKAWVRTSGGQNDAYIALKDYGGDEQRTSVPIAPPDKWLQIVVSARVVSQQCTIALVSDADGDEWVSFDDFELVRGRAALSIMGADISSLKKSEVMGGIYTDENGLPGDAIDILHNHGLNYARIRVWVNSPDGYQGKKQLLEMAKRIHKRGIKLLVDFHYSDYWADPGKQHKPGAWQNLDFEGLQRAVYDHTYDVCRSLQDQGMPPDMVQIGNEVNNGILWPDGKTEKWDNLTALLKKGYQAVKDCSPSTQVILHLAEGGRNDLFRSWFDNATQREVPFDLIGVSYYPYWHGTLADLQNNLNDIAIRYNKDIVVVETAYPFTPNEDDTEPNIISKQTVFGYPLTPEGQGKMLADVMTIVRAVPNDRGLGIFWWDATWIAVPGNGWEPDNPNSGNNWENQTLFDYQHHPLPAMDLFNKP